MKRILAILMTICLLAGALSISTSAALLSELDAVPVGTVLRVSALKKNASTVVIKDYNNFEEGWEAAVDYAEDEDYMYENGLDRIVVDLCADWKANEAGEFGEGGDGFEWSTIDIPGDIRMTINMNGYTINRDLKVPEYDGEVIHISSNADVIINSGTITGGSSNNGAGGIHIKGGARVILNDVNVVGNFSKYDGGGISVAGGATLTVNGGSFIDNTIIGLVETSYSQPKCYGGAVYVDDATAFFKGVEFKGNNAPPELYNYGAAIYADDSDVTIEECVFDRNGLKDEAKGIDFSTSIIQAVDSSIKVKDSTFTNNGGLITETDGDYSSTFMLDESELTIETSEFKNNGSHFIITDKDESLICVTGTNFEDNPSSIMNGDSDTSNDSYFRDCTFSNNVSDHKTFYDISTILTFYDCSMGDSTYDDSNCLKFVTTTDTEAPGDKPAEGVVIRVGGLKRDGSVVAIRDYKSFRYGWNSILELIEDGEVMKENDYLRIVVDIFADWIAVDGDLCESGAICIPDDVRIIINLNGHTINRGLEEDESNGEVIYVGNDSDVIINDGTITGGYSDNGAGGIHIKDDAKVTLNNVHVDGNSTKGDDGPGIAIYGGELIMNGGSVSNNNAYEGVLQSYGALYIDDSTATLNNVTISGNDSRHASIMYIVDSTVTLNGCIIENNGKNSEMELRESLVIVNDSELNIIGGEIRNNGMKSISLANMFEFKNDVRFNMSDGCKVTGNHISNMFLQTYNSESYCYINDCVFTDNIGRLSSYTYEHEEDTIVVVYTKCKFNNNKGSELNGSVFYGEPGVDLRLVDCELGNSTFGNKQYIHIGNDRDIASIFGDGSLNMIVSILALVASAVAICISISSKKKKTVVATANNAVATTDEE